MINKIYNNLNECIKAAFKISADYLLGLKQQTVMFCMTGCCFFVFKCR